MRPLSATQLAVVNDWLDVEYTYTSNWIEGNTLNRQETAMILEKGMTVAGKSLREHLEATNHLQAIHFIRSVVQKGHQYLTENTIKDIHKLILRGIDEKWAGVYRQIQVFIRGAAVEPPPPHEVPVRMRKLINWIQSIQEVHPVKVAADLHFRFVEIHPFLDGNGRTARLLTNLVLLGHGYPMMIIKTNEREAYIKAIEKGTLSGELNDFYEVIAKAVERSLDAFIALSRGKSVSEFYIDSNKTVENKLVFIGKIAKLANVTIPTIRHYMTYGLIKPNERSHGGFFLFDQASIERIKMIKKLQIENRLSLTEIREQLKD